MKAEELIARLEKVKQNTISSNGMSISYKVGDLLMNEIIKNLEQQSNWISVDDRLPESRQCVLLYSQKSGVGEGAWIGYKNHFEQWRWNAILENVTHWMPLPEPPKTKGE